MYFSNQEHGRNYDFFMRKFDLSKGEDVQYEANIYIAAYPEIYKCLDLNNLETDTGPLFLLTKWIEEEQRYIVSCACLTGATKRLVEVGLSLYNSFEIGLDDVFGSIVTADLFDVFFQACKIRARC